MTQAPKNISVENKYAFANRAWDAAMLRFLVRQRRRGKPIRWIAEKLGVSLVRAVAQAINRGLTLHTAYRGRRCANDREPGLEPLGTPREIPDDNRCRWMDAHPNETWTMCARPTDHGEPWCPHHRAKVYVARPGTAGILPALPAAPPPKEPAGSRRSQDNVTS